MGVLDGFVLVVLDGFVVGVDTDIVVGVLVIIGATAVGIFVGVCVIFVGAMLSGVLVGSIEGAVATIVVELDCDLTGLVAGGKDVEDLQKGVGNPIQPFCALLYCS